MKILGIWMMAVPLGLFIAIAKSKEENWLTIVLAGIVLGILAGTIGTGFYFLMFR